MTADVDLLEHECAHALLGADHVRDRLLSMLSMGEHNIVNTYYAVKCRVKSKSSLREKIQKKRVKEFKLDYLAASATDIVGLRILTLYSNDIVPASRDFIDFIQTCQNPTIRLFHGSTLDEAIREVIVYQSKTNNRHYKTALANFEKLPLSGLSELPKKVNTLPATDEQPYSSIHIVCNAVSFYGNESKIVPLEVQIRTVFEDAWNEVDHPIRYKGLRDKKHEFNQDDRLTANLIIDQLEKFKIHLDACGGDADNIRERFGQLMISTSVTSPESPSAYKLFDPDNDIVIDSSNGFRDPKSKAEFDDINRKIQKLFSTPPGVVEKLFDQLHAEAVGHIALLDESSESYKARNANQHALDYDFYFCTSAQKAFVLLWQARNQFRAGRGTRQQLETLMSKVLLAYRDIEKIHPHGASAFLKFRIGNALYDLSCWDAAAAEMELAVKRLASDPYLPATSRLHFIAPRQLGIILWRKRQSLWQCRNAYGDNSVLREQEIRLLNHSRQATHTALRQLGKQAFQGQKCWQRNKNVSGLRRVTSGN